MEDEDVVDESTFDYVQKVIREEGFYSAFTCMSDFPDVKDKRFHRLRVKFLKATRELEDYIQTKRESQCGNGK